jgi:hypothetical protein
VVSNSLPREFVTVAGGSATAAALPFAGVAFAFVLAFFGGIVAVLYWWWLVERCGREGDESGANEKVDEGEVGLLDVLKACSTRNAERDQLARNSKTLHKLGRSLFVGAASTKQNQGIASIPAWQSLILHHTDDPSIN